MTEGRHDHEHSDVPVRPVATFVIGLFLAMVAAAALMAGLYRYFAANQPKPVIAPSPLVKASQTPPEPRLQPQPNREYQAVRAAEDKRLNNYGWIDPQLGVVHIPIERAMDLVAERGLPVRVQQEAKK